jgi:hypothetical protein
VRLGQSQRIPASRKEEVDAGRSLSDIHGNAVALDAVLADSEARGAERLL